MNSFSKTVPFVTLTVLALALGAGGGYWYAQRAAETPPAAGGGERKVLFYRNPMNPAITSPVPAKDEMGMDYIPVYADEEAPAEREVLFYRNPMNPAITSPVPAKDEMGMDYIPVYADGAAGEAEPAGTVTIDPVTVQNIGVRSAVAEQRTLTRRIDALGRVTYDEERLARLHPKTEGWIEELFVDQTGAAVKKNTMLLALYSPQLVTSQQEYLLALRNFEAVKNSPARDMRRSAEEVLASARERLQLLDVPAHQLRELEKSRKIKKYLHIHSPFDGTVMNIGAREGQYVTPQTELYLLADLHRVWVYVDVYEDEIPWVRLGDRAEMRVKAAPGRVYQGKVSFIYPYLQENTRTLRLRLAFDNRDLMLKPGMFASVTLHVEPRPQAVVVPGEAIVRSGAREQVFVVRGAGKFEPRPVTVGVSAEGYTEILAGLDPGERVVTSAQFLIDSESKLREATAKMREAMGAAPDAGPDMKDMSMDDMAMGEMSMDNLDMSDMTMEGGQQP